jgi:hypothetical protein
MRIGNIDRARLNTRNFPKHLLDMCFGSRNATSEPIRFRSLNLRVNRCAKLRSGWRSATIFSRSPTMFGLRPIRSNLALQVPDIRTFNKVLRQAGRWID